ncbi:twin-arginine translocase subunit TatB [Proteobacteria bacterium 005FR1]|nr:twin-arginine translocase subunit TatB [Proteobacteria bacterium 005FR1]
MFDIGFTELLVIATITLIVIGPERLPETVRAVSLWIGRFKRSLRETRRELEQQIGADDIRRELHNEEIMRSLSKMRTDVSETLAEEINLEEKQRYPSKDQSREPAAAEIPPDNKNQAESQSGTGNDSSEQQNRH